MTDYSDEAGELQSTLADHDIDVEQDEIEGRLDELVGTYSVPMAEARRSVLRHYADEHDTEIEGLNSSSGGGGGSQDVDIDTIDTEDQWVAVEGKVVQLWGDNPDSIRQAGLIADATGRIKFTSWESSDLELLEEGTSYRLENVVTDSYQGRMSIQLNSSTEITELDEDIEAEDNSEMFTGAMVDIQSGSGLIKRCENDDCTRVLDSGRCSEHGEQDGQFDLRIKAVLDDGETVQETLFDREATEAFTDLTMEEAKEMAKDALDTSVVGDEFASKYVGRYYTVEGPIVGRNLLVNEVEEADAPDPTELLERVEEVEAEA